MKGRAAIDAEPYLKDLHADWVVMTMRLIDAHARLGQANIMPVIKDVIAELDKKAGATLSLLPRQMQPKAPAKGEPS